MIRWQRVLITHVAATRCHYATIRCRAIATMLRALILRCAAWRARRGGDKREAYFSQPPLRHYFRHMTPWPLHIEPLVDIVITIGH